MTIYLFSLSILTYFYKKKKKNTCVLIITRYWSWWAFTSDANQSFYTARIRANAVEWHLVELLFLWSLNSRIPVVFPITFYFWRMHFESINCNVQANIILFGFPKCANSIFSLYSAPNIWSCRTIRLPLYRLEGGEDYTF